MNPNYLFYYRLAGRNYKDPDFTKIYHIPLVGGLTFLIK